MKKTILITFASLILVFAANTAYACSCDVYMDKPEINYSDWAKNFKGVAFAGRVIKVETIKAKGVSKITFSVNTVWRGALSAKVFVSTASSSGMCGVTFEEGADYVVISDSPAGSVYVSSCAEMEFAQNREKYLAALGEGRKGQQPPRKFDEFGNINCEYELAKLDGLTIELQNDPTSTAYIIIYGGKSGKKHGAKARIARMFHYLTKSRGVEAWRVYMKDGGYRDTLSGEIWTLRPGDNDPTATPTVSAKNVKLKGTAKIRGYNCGSEMGL